MKIVCFYNNDFEKSFLEEKLTGHEVSYLPSPIQDHEDFSDSEAEVLSVFVKSKVGAAEMDKMPNLKFIATRSTGFDHIDLEEAEKRGIKVANVPTYGENTVAEQAFALLVGLSRKLYDSYDQVRSSGSFSQDGLRGFDLKDKTMGVVGTGHIGRYAIKMAKGFSMNVVAFDVKHDEEYAKETGFEYVEMDELLARSDVVTLHAPYNEHTHHMINMDSLQKMKKGLYLINTARGGLVETAALVKGLEEGIIAGAGLDVLEEEGGTFDEMTLLAADHPNEEALKNVLSNHYLIDHPNVIITPHNAFNTTEAIGRILDTTRANIEGHASGEYVNVVQKK